MMSRIKYRIKPIHVGALCNLVFILILVALDGLRPFDASETQTAKIILMTLMCVMICINLALARWQWKEATREISAELNKRP